MPSIATCILLDNVLHSHICITVSPARYLEICTTTTSYTAQYDDELTFEAGANIFIVLQNGGGW